MLTGMRLGHVELPVSDPLRSLDFYRDVLGFALDANQADQYIWISSNGVAILLRPGFEDASGDDVAAVNLVLYTDALSADTARLREAGLELTERRPALDVLLVLELRAHGVETLDHRGGRTRGTIGRGARGSRQADRKREQRRGEKRPQIPG